MNREEIENKFSNTKAVITEFEKLIKSQQVEFKIHESRLGWLKYLYDRAVELHKLEIEQLEAETLESKTSV